MFRELAFRGLLWDIGESARKEHGRGNGNWGDTGALGFASQQVYTTVDG